MVRLVVREDALKQVLQNNRDGRLKVSDVPAPKASAGQVLVRNRNSLISAGTERTTVEVAQKSLVGKAASRPDLVSKVVAKAKTDGIQDTLRMVKSRLDSPVALGYSCAGEVVEFGDSVEGFRVGDRVACAGQNYASHAEFVTVPQNLAVAIPEEVSYPEAAYVTLGAIALQGVRQTAPQLGETVAVIGLGILGQLTVQLLKANGCVVIASDPTTDRLKMATALGADDAARPDRLAKRVQKATSGHGVDAVIITASSKSDEPVRQAAEISRKKGRIIVVGAVGMTLPREPFYLGELELRLSMSYGPGRYDPAYEEGGQDYPFAYVRWTEKRNMEAFLALVAAGRVDVETLTSHRFQIDEAEKAYQLITEGQEPAMGVLLSYATDAKPPVTKTIVRQRESLGAAVTLGLIGAGNHMADSLVPHLKKLSDVEIHAVCSRTGKNANRTASSLSASYATTDYQEILDDPEIRAVLIGTRHDLHAPIVTAALRKGKHVFVEKPLCLTDQELDEIAQAYEASAQNGGSLFVGYNRGYSPHFEAARDFLGEGTGPLTMVFRVNAGALPAGHWLLDPKVGGGRIIGEGCHFIDFLQRLSGGLVESVHGVGVTSGTVSGRGNEATISCTFTDGSVGTVVYTGAGDTGLPKERCEIFGGQTSVVIEDFRQTICYRDGKKSVVKTRLRDKGFAQEITAFVRSITDPAASGQGFEELYAVSRASFRAVDSLKSGERYTLPSSPIVTR